MAYDEALAGRIRLILREEPFSEKKMFGGLAFLRRGHMFCGVQTEELMARVGPTAYEACLAEAHVRPMDFTGRPMKGYVYVGRQGLASDAALETWVRRSLAFADTLPAK
jgi:TfoX/Sxy family transcriptional regulator of competence genes